APLDAGASDLLHEAVRRFVMTGRGATRALKVARTIADLCGSDGVTEAHVAEALAFRGQEVVA
ncbi:MAG TPA: ATP-binding protein, partial [Myxococcota bacterium]|nr:ATP-binding protein [Myxococcota bacterium]